MSVSANRNVSNAPTGFDTSQPSSNRTQPSISALQRHSAIEIRAEDGGSGELVYPINYREVYNLKGRLLTLIDATFIDPEQRKAHKDVVWHTLQEWMNGIVDSANPHDAASLKAAREPTV